MKTSSGVVLQRNKKVVPVVSNEWEQAEQVKTGLRFSSVKGGMRIDPKQMYKVTQIGRADYEWLPSAQQAINGSR